MSNMSHFSPRTDNITEGLLKMLRIVVTISFLAVMGASQNTVTASFISDGSFENQAVLQNNPYSLQSSGAKWGAGWNNWGWSSWQDNSNGAWTGGAIARTEEYAAGWKWAKAGDVFGIIKDRRTMSQSFMATTSGTGSLTWYDANRAAWRDNDWYGRPNDYSVTLTDSLNNVQVLGDFTSEVAGGGSGWWTTAGKAGWKARSVSNFTMQAGMNYTLSFNSLSPYYYDANGNQKVDDRTTFLDDISLTASPVPEPTTLSLFSLGAIGCAFLRRRRQQG